MFRDELCCLTCDCERYVEILKKTIIKTIKVDCEQGIHDLGINLQQSDLTKQRKEATLTRSAEKLSHIGVIRYPRH